MELIVAFDASTESKNALKSALKMADKTDASVTAVHAIQQSVSEVDDSDGSPVIEGLDEAERRADRVLTAAQKLADEFGQEIDTDITRGSPSDAVSEYVSNLEEAAIYVGHRAVVAKKSAASSVAQRLIRKSPVPVTVVT